MVADLSKLNWHELGIQLKVPSDKLRKIEEEYHDISRRLSEVFSYWLNNGEDLSWKAVVKAVKRIGNHKRLVSYLQSKYCKPLEHMDHSK